MSEGKQDEAKQSPARRHRLPRTFSFMPAHHPLVGNFHHAPRYAQRGCSFALTGPDRCDPGRASRQRRESKRTLLRVPLAGRGPVRTGKAAAPPPADRHVSPGTSRVPFAARSAPLPAGQAPQARASPCTSSPRLRLPQAFRGCCLPRAAGEGHQRPRPRSPRIRAPQWLSCERGT